MRQGSTLALVASFCLAYLLGSSRAGAGDEVAIPTAWTLPDGLRGRRVAPILLLSRPEVQAELHMKPDQVADATRVIADAHSKALQLKGRKDQAVLELRRAVDEEQRIWLETKLAEDQVGRLSEIDLQWEGVAAIISRPAVSDSLSLSPDQRATLLRAFDDLKKHQSRSDGWERDPAAADRHFTQQVFSTLSDGQRKRWEKMLGRPVALASTAPNVVHSIR